MRHFAPETQGVSRRQRIAMTAVAIGERPAEEVNELRSGVLEARKHLARIGQGHQERLERLTGAALRRKQVVGMPAARAAPHDLQTLAGGALLRPFLVATDVLQ